MLPSLPRRPRVPEDPSGRQLPGVRVLPLPAGEGGRGEGVLDVPGPGPHGLPQPRHHPGPAGDGDARALPPARPRGPGGAAAAGETPWHSPARKPRLVRQMGWGGGGSLSGQAGDPDCPLCPLDLQQASSCPYWRLLECCSSLLAPPLPVLPTAAPPTSSPSSPSCPDQPRTSAHQINPGSLCSFSSFPFLFRTYRIYGSGGGLVAKSCLTLATPWTVVRQPPLSMGFSRQGYQSGLPFPSPGDLSDLGIKPGSSAL